MTTDAIVLHTFPYSETSKIVRLATRDHGVVSAIAKGAQHAKGKFGARLQPLSEGVARMYMKRTRDLQTLAEFEVVTLRHELAYHVDRYAAASALSELVLRFSPNDAIPEIYDVFKESLDWLAVASPTDISSVSLAAMWSVVRSLGFTPVLVRCAADGVPIAPGGGEFSIVEGGLVCSSCARSRETVRLEAEDREALVSFVGGTLPPHHVSDRHAAAHRRLCVRFITRHVAEGRETPALDFWVARR